LDCAASVERAVGEEVGDTMAVEQLKPLKEEVHRQLYPNKIGASSTIFTQSSGFLAVQNSFERKKNKKGGE